MGVKIDAQKNAIRSDELRYVSTKYSKIRVLVVPTNKELMIAMDVQDLLSQGILLLVHTRLP